VTRPWPLTRGATPGCCATACNTTCADCPRTLDLETRPAAPLPPAPGRAGCPDPALAPQARPCLLHPDPPRRRQRPVLRRPGRRVRGLVRDARLSPVPDRATTCRATIRPGCWPRSGPSSTGTGRRRPLAGTAPAVHHRQTVMFVLPRPPCNRTQDAKAALAHPKQADEGILVSTAEALTTGPHPPQAIRLALGKPPLAESRPRCADCAPLNRGDATATSAAAFSCAAQMCAPERHPGRPAFQPPKLRLRPSGEQ